MIGNNCKVFRQYSVGILYSKSARSEEVTMTGFLHSGAAAQKAHLYEEIELFKIFVDLYEKQA